MVICLMHIITPRASERASEFKKSTIIGKKNECEFVRVNCKQSNDVPRSHSVPKTKVYSSSS